MKIKNPFDRMKDTVNHDIYERFITVFDPHVIASQIYDEVNERINTHITNLKPELMTNFNLIYQEISRDMKEYKKQIEYVEKKCKKLFESSSLTEDVFKVRDELKVIKKKLDKLNNAIKSFSKLSSCIEED